MACYFSFFTALKVFRVAIGVEQSGNSTSISQSSAGRFPRFFLLHLSIGGDTSPATSIASATRRLPSALTKQISVVYE